MSHMLDLDIEQNLGEYQQLLVLDLLWLIARLGEESRSTQIQMWGNHDKYLRHWDKVSEEWSRISPMTPTPPPASSHTGLLYSWRERWLHLGSPFSPIIFLVHFLAFTRAEILHKWLPLQRLLLSSACLL